MVVLTVKGSLVRLHRRVIPAPLVNSAVLAAIHIIWLHRGPVVARPLLIVRIGALLLDQIFILVVKIVSLDQCEPEVVLELGYGEVQLVRAVSQVLFN